MHIDIEDLLVALGIAAFAWALIFATLAGEVSQRTSAIRTRTMAKAAWLFLVAATMLLVAAAAI